MFRYTKCRLKDSINIDHRKDSTAPASGSLLNLREHATSPSVLITPDDILTGGVTYLYFPRSEESFMLYLSTMPWLAVPWEQEERRRELAALLGVQGIPTLVLLDADGSVITTDGRGEVNEDPIGEVS